MRKAQAAQNPVEMRISQLSGMLSQSPHRNRRFRVAIEQMRAEKENQLRAEWMKIITPEQQKTLRRRNRQAILQASLDSQRGDRSLLDHQESIDQFRICLKSLTSSFRRSKICEGPLRQTQ
jgi:hypothetical protein